MANKSVTWKVGADTSDFTKGMNAANRSINETSKTAAELKKGLQIEWNESRFVKAQELAQKALTGTEEKAQKIREQLKFIEQSGGVDTAGYEKLQSELIKTENKAILLKKELGTINNLKFDKASKAATDFGNELDSAAKKTKGLSIAAAGLIAAGALALKKTIELGDEIQTTADKFDISAESVQRWNYIAMQSDVASDTLQKGLVKVRSSLGKQLIGDTDKATEAMSRLGITVQDFPDAESAFEATILQLAKIEDKTLQAYLANEIFGEKIATDLVPLLNQGADGIAALTKEFENVGYMSNETVKKLAEADNTLNTLKTQFTLATAELAVAFLPIMQELVKFLQENVIPVIRALAAWFSQLPQPIQNVLIGILFLTAALSPLLSIGGAVFKLIGGMIGILPKLIGLLKGVNLAAWQTYAGFAAIAAAIFLINDLFTNWSEMSTIEKILKSLAVAALIAAAAVMIFHASWSLGIAIGAIVAGIAVGAAAINAAGKQFGVPDTGGTGSGGSSGGNIPTPDMNLPDVNIDYGYGAGSGGTQDNSVVDNSVITINIYDAEQKQTSEIVAEINKYFTEKKLGYR